LTSEKLDEWSALTAKHTKDSVHYAMVAFSVDLFAAEIFGPVYDSLVCPQKVRMGRQLQGISPSDGVVNIR
jgi:hypothetical protein